MISCTAKEFWNHFEALPKGIQDQAVNAYELWNKTPHHPGLHFKTIHSTEPLYSVRISRGYRALGLKQGNTIIWFWIGSHSAYDKLISK